MNTFKKVILCLAALFLTPPSWALGPGEWELLEAITGGDRSTALELIDQKGVSVHFKNDMNGGTPLHEAAGLGEVKIAERLINKGASVNAKDDDGNTPLHDAAFGGHPDMIQLLIRYNADVNARDNYGNTPLHDARAGKRQEAAELLMQYEANEEFENKVGFTPMDYARL